jgi:hypothetical protein
VTDIFSAIWDVIANAFQFVMDPTGNTALNIFIWLVVYTGGWYAASMGLTIYATRNMQPDVVWHCSKQRSLDHYDCKYHHGNKCWSPETIPISVGRIRKMVQQNMGWAVLWPVVLSALVIFGPIAFIGYMIFQAIVVPGAIGARVVGEGIVDSTASVASMSVDVIVKRTEDINRHKALSAAKAEAKTEAELNPGDIREDDGSVTRLADQELEDRDLTPTEPLSGQELRDWTAGVIRGDIV